MSNHRMRCPHCSEMCWMDLSDRHGVTSEYGHLFFVCEDCSEPVVLSIVPRDPEGKYLRVYEVCSEGQTIEESGWTIVESWPKPIFQIEVPSGVPDHIAELYRESQQVASCGAYDLASIGHLRVLQEVRALRSPEFRGSLHSWLSSLVKAGELPRHLKSAINRDKLLRGEPRNVTARQAQQLATFCQIVLEQLFAIDARMAAFEDFEED
jgi:hypothetical protein